MSAEGAAMGRQPVNILLVDDQPGKLLSYETILSGLGENLIRATSGNEALELLLKNEIAVVLVDVCMPELDGFELASMIRSHPRFKKTAIILVSSVLVDDGHRLKGYDSGAVDYVSVPIIPEILRAKVSVFSELFRKSSELQELNRALEERVAQRTAEIEDAMARIRLILSTSGTRAWTWNISDDVVTVVTGGAGEEVVGPLERFLESVHRDDRSAVRQALEGAASGEGEFHAEFRAAEGPPTRWLLGRGIGVPGSAGRPISIAGIDVDITERKRTEEERALLLKQTQEAQREAENANKLKDQFLATLSHELRTPLTAISGWAHMLQTSQLDEPTRVKALATIRRNADLQNQLISDILDVSRIIAGKLHLMLEEVDIRSVVGAALDSCRPQAEAKGVSLLADLGAAPILLKADSARLQQVVSNLVTNAIRFGPEKGRVDLRLTTSGSSVELVVQDEGPGIAPDFLPFIFDRFRQGDSSSTRVHHGLGLGLAIVRHLVEIHGGRVEAANRVDRPGAVFRVSLPLQREAGRAETASGAGLGLAEASLLAGVRVLVVDDETDGREMVGAILHHCGAEARLAGSVPEALAAIAERVPDVVITDIEMPGEDGHTLLKRVRALAPERGGRVPVAALTAYASPEDRRKVLAAGFQRHIAKPFQPGDLVAVIARLVGVSPQVP